MSYEGLPAAKVHLIDVVHVSFLDGRQYGMIMNGVPDIACRTH